MVLSKEEGTVLPKKEAEMGFSGLSDPKVSKASKNGFGFRITCPTENGLFHFQGKISVA